MVSFELGTLSAGYKTKSGEIPALSRNGDVFLGKQVRSSLCLTHTTNALEEGAGRHGTPVLDQPGDT